MQPVLFLFVLGYGLSALVGSTGGFDFKKFVFPGVVAMSVATTAIFSAMSIVWDREFGFLREMLVAPVSRAALVLGKTCGGATVATGQGTIMLALAPLIGVSPSAPRGDRGHRDRAAHGLRSRGSGCSWRAASSAWRASRR
ncbi:MAG: ABC transporter permease [Thermoleophilia bacterium]